MALAYTNVGSFLSGKVEANPAYITATGLDTTATVNGRNIDNTDGRISYISAQISCTDKTGTSPTLLLRLQGSDDGTNFATLNNQSGSAMETSATSISGSGSGTTVSIRIDSQQSLRVNFPRYLRWQVVVGGSSSPGWNGTVGTTIVRDHGNKRKI